MKKILVLVSSVFMFLSCTGKPENREALKSKSFDELFKPIEQDQIKNKVIRLMTEEDNTVLTAGTDSLFNSMVASWSVGRYYETPTTTFLLGSKRYTLELMKKHQTFTMSFFEEEYKDDYMVFGLKSGRTSNKMKETKLTYVKTPSGNITYKEAKIVVECKLFEVTTVHPDDFYAEKARKMVEDGFMEAKDYHKIVVGTITNVWVRK